MKSSRIFFSFIFLAFGANLSLAQTRTIDNLKKKIVAVSSEKEKIKAIFLAHNGHECLEQLKGVPLAKLPQVVFMDLEMPQLDGIETIRLAKAIYPDIHFVVLTVFDDEEKIFEAIKAGASGYLLKHEPAAVLQEAVMNVLEFGGRQ